MRLCAFFAGLTDLVIVIALATAGLTIAALLNAALWVLGRHVARALGWA